MSQPGRGFGIYAKLNRRECFELTRESKNGFWRFMILMFSCLEQLFTVRVATLGKCISCTSGKYRVLLRTLLGETPTFGIGTRALESLGNLKAIPPASQVSQGAVPGLH